MNIFDERFELAAGMAARAHAGQLRKGSDIPYISHPFHVATLLLRVGAPPNVVLAGLLHDAVEDTSTTAEEVERALGPEVRALVEAVTQPEPTDERPWRAVKTDVIEHVAHASPDVVLLKNADLLHNLSTLALAVRAGGVAAFKQRFRREPAEVLWYYGSLAAACAARLGENHPLVLETQARVEELRRALGVAAS